MSSGVLSGLNKSFSDMEFFVEDNEPELSGAFRRVLGADMAKTELEEIKKIITWLQQKCADAEDLLEKGDSLMAMAETVAELVKSLPAESPDVPEWLSSLNGMIAGLKTAGSITEKVSILPSPQELGELKLKLASLGDSISALQLKSNPPV